MWRLLPICSCCYIHHFLFFSCPNVQGCYACVIATYSAAHGCLQSAGHSATDSSSERKTSISLLSFCIIILVRVRSGAKHQTQLEPSALPVWLPLKWLRLCWVKLSYHLHSHHLVSALMLKAKGLGMPLRYSSKESPGLNPADYSGVDLTHFSPVWQTCSLAALYWFPFSLRHFIKNIIA